MTDQTAEILAKAYEPHAIESKWYQLWEKSNFFKPQMQGPAYCIVIPPPNVTGSLHMGHGFQDTLMDTLIRYHRMQGYNTLWQVGTDHAGIATQMVVEKQLAQEELTRQDLGREKFTEKVWQWKHQSGGQITQQLRRLGVSVDWDRERFTLDEKFNVAVNEVFIRLYEEGLIYRGKRLVNWDPAFRSAISDLEVINSEEDGFLWYIRYPLVNSTEHLVIATTRPETLLGDVAVAVNPDDERYKKFIGKQIKLPLTDRIIPIIADNYVSPEFGTGCVKITPAHDFNDYQIGLRHDLPCINIFTEDAKINEHAPQQYQSLDRFVAREQIVKDLEAQNLLEKVTPHKLNVPRADRGNTIIEPYLTHQWYVKMKPLAEPAMAAVKNKEVELVPETWQKTFFQWLENIEDWCISRQLWWGHRIPAWYDEKNNLYVGHDEQQIRKKYQLPTDSKLFQENDVLDTWFSAALWPFASLGWPTDTTDFEIFYPNSVLVTGFDIIFFWVARMIMMGLKFTGKVPFKQVYFTGLIRDSEGHKMSKTKGNVLDPIDLIDGIDLETLIKKRTYGLMQPKMAAKIEKNTRKEFPNGIAAYGTDALRFTYCALATTGRDIRFDLNRLEGYRNFCNKIWNATRFTLMNVTEPITEKISSHHIINKWLYSRLQKTINDVTQHLNTYRFDLASQSIYEFIWNEFCDWYVEFSKIILNSEKSTSEEKNSVKKTLIDALENILRLIHPMMPFISEEIWQTLKPFTQKNGSTIMLEAFPTMDTSLVNEQIETEIAWLQKIIVSIRTIRSEMNVPPGKLISVFFKNGSKEDQQLLNKHNILLSQLIKAEKIEFLDPNLPSPPAAISLVDQLEILIPLKGLIDSAAETLRLEKEILKLDKEREKIQIKLNSPQFLEKAPKELVERDQQRVREIAMTIEQLHQKMLEIKNLEQ